jgi:NTP pyrophosphatase (non-canonical NTP hydrolase)
MNKTIELIKQWAIDRNLHTADPNKQMLKLGEEYGELCAGMARGDRELICDSIGDMVVVLTILSMQLDYDIADAAHTAYDEIKDRKGRMVDGVFIKESDLLNTCARCQKVGCELGAIGLCRECMPF